MPLRTRARPMTSTPAAATASIWPGFSSRARWKSHVRGADQAPADPSRGRSRSRYRVRERAAWRLCPASGRVMNDVVLWRRLVAALPASAFLSEIVAPLGLILVIFALARTGRSRTAPAAVGAYIGAAYFFTSSASFANPAITIGRMFSDTFAGIAPSSAPSFIAAQIIGGVLAAGVIRMLYPGVTVGWKSRGIM